MDNYYIDRAVEGDEEAFAYLVYKYKDLAMSIAQRIIKNKEDAEEIAQDSFYKAYKSLNSFKKTSKFSTWLYKIVYNTAISKYNLKSIELTELNEAIAVDETIIQVASTLASLKQQEQRKYIDIALNKLDEIDALILTLFYLNENTIEEICNITSFSNSNVKVRLYRARISMYKEISNLLGDNAKDILYHN